MATPRFLQWRHRLLIIALTFLLLLILALKLALPINLTAVDIGRHIANGQLIFAGQVDVLYKNYYSFTHLDYPFINHHWFFGVMAFVLFKVGGFPILSIFYILIMLAAVLLFLRSASLRGHQELALFIAFCVLPVLWDRREIRPEGISLLFMGLYFYLLTRLSLGTMDRRIVFWILAISQVIWVNTHIFFFMGPLLVAIFFWEGAARGCSVCVKQLRPLLIWTLLVNVLNPSGIAGMLTPLNGFKGFGYRLAENQNVFFMMSFFPKEMRYPYFIGLLLVAIIGVISVVIVKRKKVITSFIVLLLLSIVAGAKAVRLMPAFAVLFIPLGSYCFSQIQEQWAHKIQQSLRLLMLAACLIVAGFYLSTIKFSEINIGLYPNVNASANFYITNNLKGPIFSNYDIGGYLIYHLSSQEKVFVDNRQEAFPKEFFKDVYMKMQQEESQWAKVDGQYQFNVIYFYRHDLTEWGQNFLIKRIEDPTWAPVFVDDFTIIFLKRNDVNAALIAQFELPRSMFQIRKP